MKQTSSRLRILVFGAGAIGCLYAAILSSLGCQVSIVGRRRIVEAAKGRGLIVKGEVGLKSNVWDAAEEASSLKVRRGFNLILLTVKAYDVAKASRQIREAVKADGTIVVCLQNGLEVEREASENLGEGFHVVRGVSFCGAYMEEEGVVKCTGVGETVIGDVGLKVLSQLADLLAEGGFPARLEKSIGSMVWEKTLINAGINPFGALTGLRNGELLDVEGLPESIAETVREGAHVAGRLGIKFMRDPVSETFKTIRATAQNYNSMLQDIWRGKRTEIDYINGAIARLGLRVGVRTPLNSLLTSLVKGLEGGSDRCGGFSTHLRR